MNGSFTNLTSSKLKVLPIAEIMGNLNYLSITISCFNQVTLLGFKGFLLILAAIAALTEVSTLCNPVCHYGETHLLNHPFHWPKLQHYYHLATPRPRMTERELPSNPYADYEHYYNSLHQKWKTASTNYYIQLCICLSNNIIEFTQEIGMFGNF